MPRQRVRKGGKCRRAEWWKAGIADWYEGQDDRRVEFVEEAEIVEWQKGRRLWIRV